MRKPTTVVVIVTVLMLTLVTSPSYAADPYECESTYTVRRGDSLSRIAQRLYRDWSAYPAIDLATDAAAATDDAYKTITDPNFIVPGWKLCIPSAETALTGLTAKRLGNAEYASQWTASGTAKLTRGWYSEAAAPGSATKTVITLHHLMAFGELVDGRPAAAVVLITDPGGSGTFRELAVVVQADGELVNVATTLLGDRVRIKSLAIENGEIAVNMVTHGSDDPMCCPTKRETQRYSLQDDGLAVMMPETEGEMSEAAGLVGPLWRLLSFRDAEGDVLTVLSDTTITVRFGDGDLIGNAGCNSYFGPYESTGADLSIGLLGATQKFCSPEEVMVREGHYLTALVSSATYRLVDDRLMIFNSNGKLVLTFEVWEPAPLVGTRWVLSSCNNGTGGMVSVLADTEITAEFDEDGGVTGSAGCNNYMAAYDVEGDAIDIGPAATTRMACEEPEGIMEQEQAYLAALEPAASLSIEGDTLEFTDVDGTRLATFTVSEGS